MRRVKKARIARYGTLSYPVHEYIKFARLEATPQRRANFIRLKGEKTAKVS